MKTHWKIIFVSLLIGGFLGAAACLAALRYCKPDWKHDRPHSSHMRKKLYRELQLSPEQKTKVDAILKASREKLDKLVGEGRPKLESIRQETKTEIRKLLTAEQQIKFDVLSAKMEARRAEREKRREKFRD